MSYQTDSFRRERQVAIRVQRQRCGKAVTAAWLGPIVFVPLAPLAGTLLGFVSMSDMKRNAALSGRGAAVFGVVAGIVMTVAQVGAAAAGLRAASDLSEGPRTAVQSGYAGRTDRMTEWFVDGAVSEAEAAAFVQRLKGRYGRLLDVRPESKPMSWRPGEAMSYTLLFERGEAPASAYFEMSPSVGGKMMRLNALRVDDARWGAVVLPASAAELSRPDPADPSIASGDAEADGADSAQASAEPLAEEGE